MPRLAYLTFAALLVLGCSKSEPPTSSPQPSPTSGSSAPTASANAAKDPAKARSWIAAGATVIDVRTAEEFAEGHLPSATLIPVAELDARLAELDQLVGGDHGKPVVVYCASGNRAGKAVRKLEAAGYTQLVNGGGLDELQ